jgi:hypothetical protein
LSKVKDWKKKRKKTKIRAMEDCESSIILIAILTTQKDLLVFPVTLEVSAITISPDTSQALL